MIDLFQPPAFLLFLLFIGGSLPGSWCNLEDRRMLRAGLDMKTALSMGLSDRLWVWWWRSGREEDDRGFGLSAII
jgi:hypothetical protein